jgi:hypothetical protein
MLWLFPELAQEGYGGKELQILRALRVGHWGEKGQHGTAT